MFIFILKVFATDDDLSSRKISGIDSRISVVQPANHREAIHSDKSRHRRDKQYPPFEVIKCIVEQMNTLRRITTKADVPHQVPNVDAALDYMYVTRRRHINSRCHRRYRRHKPRGTRAPKVVDKKSKDENSASKSPSTTIYPPELIYSDRDYQYFMDITPKQGANCTTISTFLSNDTHLRFVHQKTKDLHCKDGDLQRMFHTLRELDNVRTQHEGNAGNVMDKWKRLACRVYQGFINCTHKSRSLTSGITSGINSHPNQTHDNADNDIIATSKTKQTIVSDKEAVHVSDPSHIDFLNFMIGHDTDWSDNYQMWFY